MQDIHFFIFLLTLLTSTPLSTNGLRLNLTDGKPIVLSTRSSNHYNHFMWVRLYVADFHFLFFVFCKLLYFALNPCGKRRGAFINGEFKNGGRFIGMERLEGLYKLINAGMGCFKKYGNFLSFFRVSFPCINRRNRP